MYECGRTCLLTFDAVSSAYLSELEFLKPYLFFDITDNMDLFCYKCDSRFDEIKTIFTHLKKHHRLVNGKEKLSWLVRNANCGKSFQNFDSLRQHIKVCVQSVTAIGVYNKMYKSNNLMKPITNIFSI